VSHLGSFDTVFALGLRDRQEPIKKADARRKLLVRFFIGSKASLTGDPDAGFVPVRGDTMTIAQTRRRRPHPARRARKIAGSISIAGLLALTGCMAATKTSTSAPTAAATSATTPTSTTATTTTAAESDDSSPTGRSSTVGAVAATASAQTNTSTHGS